MSFTNLANLIDLADKKQTKIALLMIEKEAEQTDLTPIVNDSLLTEIKNKLLIIEELLLIKTR